MSELLSEQAMVDLTGAKTKAKQIQVLRDSNIPFVVRVDGWPKTTWYNVNNPSHLRGITIEEEAHWGEIG